MGDVAPLIIFWQSVSLPTQPSLSCETKMKMSLELVLGVQDLGVYDDARGALLELRQALHERASGGLEREDEELLHV